MTVRGASTSSRPERIARSVSHSSLSLLLVGALLLGGAGAVGLLSGGGVSSARTGHRGASSRGGRTRLSGPAELFTGFTDGRFSYDPGALYSRARSLDATWVRVPIAWSSIAPADEPAGFDAADPAAAGYDWSGLDASLRRAAAEHLQVVLEFEDAPVWAEGADRPSSAAVGTWSPEPAAVRAFAHALAERYSGHFPDPLHPGQTLPRITHFQVWNEPNLSYHLSPQWSRSASGAYTPASPGIYRALLNAAYAGITAAQPKAVVLAAGTAPYGSLPGHSRMYPVVFLRMLLCLRGAALRPAPCPDPAHLDALDHHPYSNTPTAPAVLADDVAIVDIGKLQRIVAAAQRLHRVLPAGPKPFWITELDWPSTPPESHAKDPYAVTLGTQARYLSLAFYELWREHVTHVFWYLVQDNPQEYGFGGAGVFFDSGQPKPAAAAFRFPFVAFKAGTGSVRVWGRAPRRGPVVIQALGDHGWERVASLPTTPGGVFEATVHATGAPARVRAGVAGRWSPSFTAST